MNHDITKQKVDATVRFKTDGVIVSDNDGGFMGIFSTVSLLNDKIDKIKELEAEVTSLKRSVQVILDNGLSAKDLGFDQLGNSMVPDGYKTNFELKVLFHAAMELLNESAPIMEKNYLRTKWFDGLNGLNKTVLEIK